MNAEVPKTSRTAAVLGWLVLLPAFLLVTVGWDWLTLTFAGASAYWGF